MSLTGLFVGAGASYELGMPLVWELTKELKAWLTPDELQQLNVGWMNQGGGYPKDVVDDLAGVLIMPDLHYEAVLGYIETQFRRPSQRQKRQDYHGLYSWLVEVVYHLLYYRHVQNEDYICASLPFFEGFAQLAELNHPLWVFSLNHDLMIECLAAHYGIPLCSGFSDQTVQLPRRDRTGKEIGRLSADVLTAEQLEAVGMFFLQRGSRGVNLLKIHGALDVFAFNDGKDLMKLRPLSGDVSGVLGALRSANEQLLYVPPESPHVPVKVTNGIVYADDVGEMQLLRRSLLAGAFKFDQRESQVLPMRLLGYFRSYLNYVSHLICIGYGFGDVHINRIMREWLEFSADRRIDMVGPNAKTCPSCLLHLSPQIKLTECTATDYLERLGSKPLPLNYRTLKTIRSLARTKHDALP